MATPPQRPYSPLSDRPLADQGPAERPFTENSVSGGSDIPIDHRSAETLERVEGSELRRPVEQVSTSAAAPITTDAEPIRPTPDDALHGMPPDLTRGDHPHREADEALHWGALAAIAVVIGLFLWALGTLISAGG